MRIQESDEWKTTFKIRYNHFEYVVMPFDLTNAPIVFQHLMNDFFHEYLDDFVVCHINDIFIFSKNMENHKHHIHIVLENFGKLNFTPNMYSKKFFRWATFHMNFIN
jgi:hypothetical protein